MKQVRTFDILRHPSRESDPERKVVYGILQNTNIIHAYAEEDTTKNVSVGLHVVRTAVERILKEEKEALPDFLYIETSLFPERTRYTNRVKSFIVMMPPKSTHMIDDSGQFDRTLIEEKFLRKVYGIYNAVHFSGCAPYLVPDFFLAPREMLAAFSRCDGTESAAATKPQGTVDESEEKFVEGHLNAAWEEVSTYTSQFVPGQAGHVLWGSSTAPYCELQLDLTPSEMEIDEKRPNAPKGRLKATTVVLHELMRMELVPTLKNSYLLAIPLAGAGPHGNGTLAGAGAMFIMFGYERSECYLEKEDTAKRLASTAAYIMKDLFLPYLYESARDMVREAVNHSLRSAIASILARNMSHNMGSHVLSYMIHEDISAIAPLKERRTQEIHDSMELYLSRRKHFLVYLRGRMDFIAEVSTYWRSMPWLDRPTL